jgi:hypothetical protein
MSGKIQADLKLKSGGLTVTNWTKAPYYCDDCQDEPFMMACRHHQLIEVLEKINEILWEMNEKF